MECRRSGDLAEPFGGFAATQMDAIELVENNYFKYNTWGSNLQKSMNCSIETGLTVSVNI